MLPVPLPAPMTWGWWWGSKSTKNYIIYHEIKRFKHSTHLILRSQGPGSASPAPCWPPGCRRAAPPPRRRTGSSRPQLTLAWAPTVAWRQAAAEASPGAARARHPTISSSAGICNKSPSRKCFGANCDTVGICASAHLPCIFWSFQE